MSVQSLGDGNFLARCPHCEWEKEYASRKSANSAVNGHLVRAHEIVDHSTAETMLERRRHAGNAFVDAVGERIWR